MAKSERQYSAGRDTSQYRKGRRVAVIDELRIGDKLWFISHQFKAENILVITRLDPPPWSKIRKLIYADYEPGSGNGSNERAIWDHDLHHPWYEFWRAVKITGKRKIKPKKKWNPLKSRRAGIL